MNQHQDRRLNASYHTFLFSSFSCHIFVVIRTSQLICDIKNTQWIQEKISLTTSKTIDKRNMRSRSFHYRHHSFIPTARHRTYQSNANRSHYDANRYSFIQTDWRYEWTNYFRLTVNRNSQKPSNFNEQTWYHSTSDNKRHYSGKWDGP